MQITKAEMLAGYEDETIVNVVNLYPAENWILGLKLSSVSPEQNEAVYWDYT